MKKVFKNKKLIIALVLSVVIAGTVIGGTTALLTSRTQTVTNTFTVGSIETELLEVVSGSQKEPYVLNCGKNDCFVRMRVTVSPIEDGKSLSDYVDGVDSSKWTLGTDGFYYYTEAVEPGRTTEVPLFKSVKPGTANSTIEIQLYQEAVQAEVTTPKGVKLTAYEDIWDFYEKYPDSNN